MNQSNHPVFKSIRPLLDALGGRVIEPDALVEGDIPISWQGAVVGGVRLEPLSLERMVNQVEEDLGARLTDLSRAGKQSAVRILDERGAFQLRKSIEDVAALMGVSRITIYNYLNAIRKD